MSVARELMTWLSQQATRVDELSLPMDRYLALCGEAGGVPDGREHLILWGPRGSCRVRGYGEATPEGWCAHYAAFYGRSRT